MTFEEWVKFYEKKSGDTHEVRGGYTTLYDKDKGYAQFKVDNGRLWVHEVGGDGRYWYSVAEKICTDNNIPMIVAICTRPILPYLRLMGAKITKKEIQPDRNNAYKIEGVNHKGLRFWCWAAWYDEDKKRPAYYVVNEVIKNEI